MPRTQIGPNTPLRTLVEVYVREAVWIEGVQGHPSLSTSFGQEVDDSTVVLFIKFLACLEISQPVVEDLCRPLLRCYAHYLHKCLPGDPLLVRGLLEAMHAFVIWAYRHHHLPEDLSTAIILPELTAQKQRRAALNLLPFGARRRIQ